MDRPVTTPKTMDDVQGRADSRQIPINKVGIKDIYHPVRVRDRTAGEQHTVANFNMYVALPHNFKGTHMSRFVEVLHQHEREISVESFREYLEAKGRGPIVKERRMTQYWQLDEAPLESKRYWKEALEYLDEKPVEQDLWIKQAQEEKMKETK